MTTNPWNLPEEYEHIYSGKVRDLYRTPEGDLLLVATDRISAYDFVLDTLIPDKGKLLTQMSLWWFEQLEDVVPNHVVSADVPDAVTGRALRCANLEMYPVECVVRGYLTGSGLADYRESGAVCGVALPPGVVDGSKLPAPIFTPATKAALGDHDENISFEAAVAVVGQDTAAELRRLSLAIYERAHELARDRGIVLADTKFEFGTAITPSGSESVSTAEGIVLADEVLTPDSSRFWPADQWEPGRTQPSFDKQYVRDWLTSDASGWDRRSGQTPPPLPDHVVSATRDRYVEAYERITGQTWSA